MSPYINPEFRARRLASSPRQITGHVELPIDAQARDVTPAPPTAANRNYRRYAYCVSLAFPIAFAVWAIVIGDMRVAMILLLMTLFMAVVGLFTLDGPA